ncbi:MAG: shikimate dehydrogenase [Spirochaetes bacterium GWF1_41_5]|nr:MAG: shikimate dehydrogenase [Spirochaetes bacterium GWF1_41_5]
MINSSTRVYGLLGFPVEHSLSPAVHNAGFCHHHLNACYVAFPARNTEEAIKSVRALSICGLSVTIPHKERAFLCVDETDEYAKISGCINTIKNDNGRLSGRNFDGAGAVHPLASRDKSWKEKNICIIGNGGAARGIALYMCGICGLKKLAFLARRTDRPGFPAEQLAGMGAEITTAPLADAEAFISEKKIDIIINTTPMGMYPYIAASPLAEQCFTKNMLVYDIIYNPEITAMLRMARQRGAEIIGGTEMFINQAACQFEFWTAKSAPRKKMLQAFKKGLKILMKKNENTDGKNQIPGPGTGL